YPAGTRRGEALVLAAAQPRMVYEVRIPLDSRKSVRPFKVVICDDVSEFESYHLSHAVGAMAGRRAGETQERRIVGETPNLAARLQGIAEPNVVVICNSTRRLVGNLFELDDLGPKDIKGLARPSVPQA